MNMSKVSSLRSNHEVGIKQAETKHEKIIGGGGCYRKGKGVFSGPYTKPIKTVKSYLTVYCNIAVKVSK
jgi:hypothetical protein